MKLHIWKKTQKPGTNFSHIFYSIYYIKYTIQVLQWSSEHKNNVKNLNQIRWICGISSGNNLLLYLFYCRTVPLSLFISLSFSVLQGSLDPCILHCNHKRSGLPLTGPPDCYKVICEAVATCRRTRSRNISLSNQTSHVNGCTDLATELQWLVEISLD